jgi:hypothetical protein
MHPRIHSIIIILGLVLFFGCGLVGILGEVFG